MNQNPSPMFMGDRPLPHQAEVEKAVLSALLQEPEATYGDLDRLTTADFYVPLHKRLYATLTEMAKTKDPATIDLIAIDAFLASRGQSDEVGGLMMLRDVSKAIPSIANFQEHIKTVKMVSRQRQLIQEASIILGKAFETPVEDVPALIGEAEQTIQNIAEGDDAGQMQWVGDVVPAANERIMGKRLGEIKYVGYPTSIRNVNNVLGGMKPGEMIVVGARPSIGKTTFMINLALGLARDGICPAIFSLETGTESLTEKVIHIAAKLSSSRIAQMLPDELRRILDEASIEVASLPILMDDTRRYYEDITTQARVAVRKQGARVLMMDYFQIMQTVKDFKNSNDKYEYMSNGIQALARDLGVPIIVLAQMNRDAEGGGGKISHLKNTGALEQDADVVGLLDRKRETDDDETAAQLESGMGIETRLKVVKNRNGRTGTAKMTFYPESSTFTNYSPGYNPEA